MHDVTYTIKKSGSLAGILLVLLVPKFYDQVWKLIFQTHMLYHAAMQTRLMSEHQKASQFTSYYLLGLPLHIALARSGCKMAFGVPGLFAGNILQVCSQRPFPPLSFTN